MSKIVVVGSANMDLMIAVPALPKPGETVRGHDFLVAPGGKGANQATAAARLGGDVGFIGSIGDDDFGKSLEASLLDSGDRKSTRLNSSHVSISYAVFCLKKKTLNFISA